MTDLERQLVTALRYAWHELNRIRARDGTAYHYKYDGMPYCTVEWWNELTEMCDQAIEAATGEPPRPWPFKWELNDQDSATVVAAILNPPEPNQALKDAAGRHQAMSKEGPMTDRTIRIRITGPFSDGDLAEIIATLRRLDQKFDVTITDAEGSMDQGATHTEKGAPREAPSVSEG